VRRVGLFLFLTISVVCAAGQVFDLQTERVPMAELHGLWRFHTGDDPRWAQAGFDDSGWPLLRSDQPWSSQGYRNYTGVAWYRFEVKTAAGHSQLAVAIPEMNDAWQLFADGKQLGQLGGLPPHPYVAGGFSWVTMEIPESMTAHSPIVFALRVWHWPYFGAFTGPGPGEPVLVGDTDLVQRQEVLRRREAIWQNSSWITLTLVCLVATVAGLGFFLLRRKEYEYLWFAGLELALAVLCLFNMAGIFAPFPVQTYEWGLAFILLISGICWPNFIVSFLKQPRGKLYWGAIAGAALITLSIAPALFEWMSMPNWLTLTFVCRVPSMVFLILLILLPARRGVIDARLLLVPEILNDLSTLASGVILISRSLGHEALSLAIGRWVNKPVEWPFRLSVQTMVLFINQIAILAILVLRFARSRRDEERMTGELEAARVVQQILVPQEIPQVPGFVIGAVYRPAGEVGGDFFQVIPIESGGVLTVVGDVSGKGMPAAMTVSLLVGTVRTLAHYTQSPGEILAAMNQRMLGRSQGGFTTCLVLRLDVNGTLTVANAGHLSPYRNGEELAIEGGLPLGLDAGSTYEEARFELGPRAQLTLLTDGVVEARSSTGELLGFARAQNLSRKSAEQILEEASAFGQEDDITVVTLALASPV
jgi:Stage II sporulation protein E (SpoIIE)